MLKRVNKKRNLKFIYSWNLINRATQHSAICKYFRGKVYNRYVSFVILDDCFILVRAYDWRLPLRVNDFW